MAAKKKNDNMAATAEKTLADRGKEAAVRFLERRGYDILDVDWGCEQGTVDIVCKYDDAVVFVAVGTPVTSDEGFPSYEYGPGGLSGLEKVAVSYLATTDLADCPVRFDRIDMILVAPDRCLIRHHINATGAISESVPDLADGEGDGTPKAGKAEVCSKVLQIVERHLENGGFEILDRGWSQDGVPARFDFIAKDEDGKLVFIVADEVGDCHEGVGASLARSDAEMLAAKWVADHPEVREGDFRVDRVSVVLAEGDAGLVRHHPNILGLAA